MSEIRQINGQVQDISTRPTATPEKRTEEVKEEPKDKVELSKKDISTPRKVIEKTVGAPFGLVTMAGNAVGGVLSGGAAGIGKEKEYAEDVHPWSTGLTNIAGGAAAGFMVGGPVGAAVGGAGGVLLTVLSAGSEQGSLSKIGKSIGETSEKAVSNNPQSDLKVRDGVRDATEGAIVGSIKGGVEGFKVGTVYGEGIVSGVIEGTKGFAGSLAGTYEKPEVKEEKETKDESFTKKTLKAIASTPRNLLKFVAGTATGTAGAAMGALDGAVQGTIVGMSDSAKGDAGFHKVMRGLQLVTAGAVAGFAVGGVVGVAVGLIGGAVASSIMKTVGKNTGSDKKFAEGLTDAIEHAQKDNIYKKDKNEYGEQDKNVYESFRDGIEGMMTGTGAGIREGFKETKQIGTGIVDGVFDGVKTVAKETYKAAKGIAKGIPGGVKGAFAKVEVEKEPGTEPKEGKPVEEKQAEEKTFAQKVIEVPGKILKGVVGTAVGAASVPLHVIPGAVKGLHSAGQGYDSKSTGPLHVTMGLQNTALGAGAGFLYGGPIGAAVGGAAGLAVSLINSYVAEKNGKYEELAEKIDAKVSKALEDNKGSKTEVLFQNMTEGTIIGSASVASHGFTLGKETGEKTVNGLINVAEGVAEGAVEVAGNVLRGGPREIPEEKKQS
jgi:hypothetical protein